MGSRRQVTPGATGMDAAMRADDLTIYELIIELRRSHGERTPSYQTIWQLISSARLPAHRKGARGWRIKRHDVPTIAKAGGDDRDQAEALVSGEEWWLGGIIRRGGKIRIRFRIF